MVFSTQYSVSFSFFLHGESTVCASLDIRQHTAVQRVTTEHIQKCLTTQTIMPVILAPYGISAGLTGLTCDKKDDDMTAESEAWSTFYPLRSSHEYESTISCVTGLPFFAMATPISQSSRQQNRFGSDKKRPLEETNRRCADVPPKFVEVIVDGFRMRYPMCFVLVTAENDSSGQQDNSATSENEVATHYSEVPGQSLQTSVSAPFTSSKSSFMHDTHILSKLKTSSFWRTSKRKKRTSLRNNRIRDLAWLKTVVSSSPIQSDFLVDIRHIYLAGRTLQRASQGNHSVISIKEWQPKRLHTSDKDDISGNTDGVSVSLQPEMNSLSLQDPCTVLQCSCNRFSRLRRTTAWSSFHQQDPYLRKFLKASVHSYMSFCDRPKTPLPVVTTNLSATHDPSMPTLSPQQPAPNQTSNLNSSAMLNELNGDFACDQNPSLSTPTSVHLPTAPQLPSLLPKPESNSVSSSVIKVPNGLVAVDSSVSLDSQTQYAKMSTRRIPIASMSVAKSNLFNTWLAGYAAQELHKEPFADIKRPTLYLNIPDQIEREQYAHADGVSAQPTFEQSSPNYSLVDENTFCKDNNAISEECLHRNKRLRPAVSRTDYNECYLNDNASIMTTDVSNVNFTSGNPYSPDVKVGVSEYSGLTDDPSCTALEMNTHSALLHSLNGSVVNSTGTFNRNVGLIAHRGVSLASSTGSGHIGPAELALMLPTPPSHDAPQPSPVDGISVVTNRVNTSTNSVSTPGPGSPSVQTILDPSSSVASDIPCHPNSLAYQPANSPQILQNQGLWHLAKQPCIQHLSCVSTESQDWSFLYPYASYLGMTSNYQIPHEEISSFAKSLPQMKWSYDHRVSSQKAVTSECSDSHNTNNALIINTTSNPSVSSKSWLVSPNQLPPASLHRNATSIDNKSCSPQQLNESINTYPVVGFVKSADSMNQNGNFKEEFAEWLASLRETSGLLVNLILSDSMLNLFKDHNFDSCNICECTSSILGSEIGLYLSNSTTVSSPCSRSARTSTSAFGHDLVGGSGFHFTRGCKCGFSAVMNQKYVVNGNLFYEDEIEVTRLSVRFAAGQNTENLYSRRPNYRRRPGWWLTGPQPSVSHLLLLQQIMSNIFEEFSVRQVTDLLRWNMLSRDQLIMENTLEYDDACALISSALRHSAETINSVSNLEFSATGASQSPIENGAYVHPSFFLKARSKMPQNQNDQIRLLTTMRPWLQEAISSTRMLESNYTVDGPLTWKAFHQLAGRGSDETCKPQPIPQLRVCGCDQDNLLISPFAVRDWDRLSLFPLSRAKRIAYAVVLPTDSHALVNPTSNIQNNVISEGTGSSSASNLMRRSLAEFLKELSHTYESCHLGQHFPYYMPEAGSPETAFIPVFPTPECLSLSENDGFKSLPPDLLKTLSEQLGNYSISAESIVKTIHNYASNCVQSTLAALKKHGVAVGFSSNLSQHSVLFPPFDTIKSDISTKSNLDNDGDDNDVKVNITNRHNISLNRTDNNFSIRYNNGQGSLTTSLDTSSWGADNDIYLVIYILNPFCYLCDVSAELSRLVMQALIGCANQILNSLPDSWRSRVTTQLLSLDHVMSDYLPRLRPMALSLYTSVNRLIEPSLINANRTLTGLGPAAEKETISSDKDNFHKRTVFAPPYTLISSRDLSGHLDLSTEPLDRSSVLFVAYCLSQDQQWLLATFTDEQGGLLDHTLINIRVPAKYFSENESQRLQSTGSEKCMLSPRRIGLARLWDYIINLVGQTANPWRLVVGRIGRLGHGELKGWNGLLGRKSLQDVNKFFRDRCSACSISSSIPSHSTSNSSMINSTKPMLNLINSHSGANSCTHELPSLISACLVSLEPQSTFRVYPGFGLCSDEPWAYGGGGGGGGAGGMGSGSTGISGGSGGLNNGGNNAFYGGSASSLNIRMMSMLDTPTSSIDNPSATHILVFPTSTSASGVSEHEPSGLAEVIYGMGSDDMGVFDWLLPHDSGLDDLVPPNGSTAEMLADFGNPSELNFGLPDLGPPVCMNGVGDGIGKSSSARLGDASDGLHGHNDYVNSLHDGRGHGRMSDIMGLRGFESGLLDMEGNQSNGMGGHMDELSFGHAMDPLNTMPFGIHDPTDEVASLMQQPLAMGYYISTASAGPLPSWFWAACPHSRFQYPVCLKSALHLQTTLVGVDDAAAAAAAPPPSASSTGPGVVGPSSSRPGHLLDSHSTCDVLRYVLETYNALSWLTIDPTTNDRRTCLPVHILSLSQMYQAFEAFT
ncbi:unnamed protein product [Trichobilharzia szidati]|nr:unnamed protein product [Trichobilharzia szidati]